MAPNAFAGAGATRGRGSLGGANVTMAGGSDETLQNLVGQIKALQRSDMEAKEQWAAYVEQGGQGRHDPAKHNVEFLETFLAQLHAGTRVPVPARDGNDWACGEVIKSMQKKSSAFKLVWESFCKQYGNGRYDPVKHDYDYHTKFFDFMAQQACSGSAMLMGGSEGGPSKRMRDHSGMAVGMAGDGSLKDQLAAQVKAFQRMGVEQKDLWSHYADTYLQGVYDPARHDSVTLQEFCDNHQVPKVEGQGGFQGAEKEQTVKQVKAYCRMGNEQYNLWSAYADAYLQGVRDPSKHDAATLQEFCTNHHVPKVENAPPGSIGGGGPRGAALGLGGEREQLVNQVKAFQRMGNEQHELWGSWAETYLKDIRDPSKHDAAALRKFCEYYSVPKMAA